VVIHKALLAQEGAEVLAAAVAPPQPPEAPIHFSLPRKHDTGVV
jgi:hypothetical protein